MEIKQEKRRKLANRLFELYSGKFTERRRGFVKNKVTAGILGIFLGSFGVHKFYLGKTGMGVLYLVFCWTGIPGIVGLIEGILYLTKSQEAFDAEFNGGRNSDAGVGSANAETLERLAALRQRGDISEEEYSEKKSDLLKRI